jgi:hypothetical protein
MLAGSIWLAPGCIFVGSCLLYLINLDRSPWPDELYHVLAARGFLEHGEPRIAEGLYDRVFAYTWLVSRMFAVLGESLAAARLPSLLAMAALNTWLFVWLRREADARVAWLSAGLFAISPFALETAQFARFYALQSLSFFGSCVAIYEAAKRLWPPDHRTIVYVLAGLAGLGFAVYLQPTTFLGIAGLGLWLSTVIAVPWLAAAKVMRRRKLLAVGLGLIACAAVLGVSLATGLAAEFWHRYRWTPPWNEASVNEFWYYHVFYMLFYPSLWPVIGLLSLAALAYWPRVAWFAMVIFAVGFLLNSFAGPKSPRYLVYAQPFLFILFGLGLAALLPWLARAAGAFRHQLDAHLTTVGLAGRRLPEMLLIGALLVVLVANAALLRTVTLLADVTVSPQLPPIQWQAVRPVVGPLLSEAEVVVTMAELETLYFWERYDVLFSPSRLTEMAEQHEFAADDRTGRPVISTRDSLARLVDCTASGLFVAPTRRWRLPQVIDAETTAFIERNLPRLDLPASSELIVFHWQHRPPAEGIDTCAAIRELLPPRRDAGS